MTTLPALLAELQKKAEAASGPVVFSAYMRFLDVATPEAILALLAHIDALESALAGLIPGHRDPDGRCWCPQYWDRDRMGHSPACERARAALAEQGEPK